MSGATDPLVPLEVDLRDFAFTPIFRSRLFGSSFHARVSDTAWRAGVTLWLKSWDQVPAGTLPEDEIDLCRLAELGRDLKTWRKIAADALWGWVRCVDGRLHHPVVAQGVMEAWQRKQEQRARTEAARAAKLAKRLSQEHSTSVRDEENLCDSRQTNDVTGSKGQRQGQSKKEPGEIPDAEALSVRGERTVKRNSYPIDFVEFWSGYPTEPNMSKKEAFEVWRRISEEERGEAIKALPAFKDHCRANPDYKPVHACRFLSKRRAEGFLEVADKIAKSAGVHVKQGTAQWDAWAAHRGKAPPIDKDGGWKFPAEWPPTPRAEAVH